MEKRFHLANETPEEHLNVGLQRLSRVFTNHFNRLLNEQGYYFQGRFKPLPVEDIDQMSKLYHFFLNSIPSNLE
ncbi:hypothetical protein [Pelagicoccus sp. SDUM812005]|uniref:hypothetical protein n=1 Tax=Pelagicoccus sp. SDUM812005 TaxID=3041257 RepID=UPI00280E9F56|nr:hypothetical protein [Pelagicoccus sp. SDUM812005]MDQ8182591.1 hypothetical protein [Pelagicoccus sp. SDUM812005]